MNDASAPPDFARFNYGRFAAWFLLVCTVAGLGLLVPAVDAARLPDDATGPMAVAFLPGTTPEQAFAAIQAAGGLPLRRAAIGPVWIVQADSPGFVAEVRAQGAVGAFRDLPLSVALAGCAGVIAAFGR